MSIFNYQLTTINYRLSTHQIALQLLHHTLAPDKNGVRWCSSAGLISRIGLAIFAFPPASAVINTSGLHSYCSLSFPFGLSTVPGT